MYNRHYHCKLNVIGRRRGASGDQDNFNILRGTLSSIYILSRRQPIVLSVVSFLRIYCWNNDCIFVSTNLLLSTQDMWNHDQRWQFKHLAIIPYTSLTIIPYTSGICMTGLTGTTGICCCLFVCISINKMR